MSDIKTRSALKSLITSNFPSGTGAISAADLREWANAITESALLLLEAGEADYIVINMTTTSPPGSPSDGDTYVVAASATGDWSGQDDNVAIWDASESPAAWNFVTPTDGMAVWNLADDTQYRWDAGVSPAAWVAQSSGGLQADTTAELSVGYSHAVHDAGTTSSGTFTPDEADGAMQEFVNGGAFTLAPPTNDCSLLLQGTNNASAGAITTSGFTIVTGDSLTTTDGDDFLFYVSKINGFSHLHVVALQ